MADTDITTSIEAPKKPPGRPPKEGGAAPKRNIRMGDDWERARENAKSFDMTVTAYVTLAVTRLNTAVKAGDKMEDRPAPKKPGPAAKT